MRKCNIFSGLLDRSNCEHTIKLLESEGLKQYVRARSATELHDSSAFDVSNRLCTEWAKQNIGGIRLRLKAIIEDGPNMVFIAVRDAVVHIVAYPLVAHTDQDVNWCDWNDLQLTA